MEVVDIHGNRRSEEKSCLGARAFDLLKRLCCKRVVNPIPSEYPLVKVMVIISSTWNRKKLFAYFGNGFVALEHSFGCINLGFHTFLMEK